ncbi:MAG: hypothetical protein KBT34_03365 [Prevotella sp.]|nr:hypothetical protein [Candidatus Prevotella equi]
MQAKKKTAEGPQESDSIQLFRGVAVSYNLAGTVIRAVSDYGEIEAAARVNLRDRYFPTLEFGLGSAKHALDPISGIEAKTNAPFFRLGCDFNVLRNKHDIYRLMFGARYAMTHFTQKAYGDIVDPYWGGTLPYYAETTSTYHWAELLLALDARMWGPVRLGWSFRYKFHITGDSKDPAQQLWYIPGFGKNGNVLGATFNVTVELWRKNKR